MIASFNKRERWRKERGRKIREREREKKLIERERESGCGGGKEFYHLINFWFKK